LKGHFQEVAHSLLELDVHADRTTGRYRNQAVGA
jgi:hypothetical protein